MFCKRTLFVLTLAIASGTCMDAQTWPVRGGSNFNWYNSSPDPCIPGIGAGCLDPYNVITNYAVQQTTINAAISQLVTNGQQRLRLFIFHTRGGSTCTTGSLGTVMDSTGGHLSTQCAQNLTNLLASMKTRGIQEVAVTFGPLGEGPSGGNYPYGDTTSCAMAWPAEWSGSTYIGLPPAYESFYQENWNLIVNLKPILDSAGLNIKIDLLNEGIGPTLDGFGNSCQGGLDYARRLWIDYNLAFPKNSTFGYSVIPDSAKVINFNYVYGGNKPYLLDVHMYPGTGGGTDVSYTDAYNMYVNTYNLLNANGYNLPWIIGETWYNSPNTAAAFKAANTAIGNVVFWLVEWPEAYSGYWYSPPTGFSAYSSVGF